MIRIIIADDERFMRDAAAIMLGLEEDIEVVGVAATGTEAVALARRELPDLVVADLQMPEMDGIEAAQVLADDARPIPTLIITSYALPGSLQRALDAGVRGFIPKDTPATEVAEVIRKVASGKIYVDPEIAVQALTLGGNPLSLREREILALSVGGRSVEAIAKAAGISSSTVRNHISSALTKLEVNNRHEAAHLAASRGWL